MVFSKLGLSLLSLIVMCVSYMCDAVLISHSQQAHFHNLPTGNTLLPVTPWASEILERQVLQLPVTGAFPS